MRLFYYLVGFHRCDQMVSEFLIFDRPSLALEETRRLEEYVGRTGASCERFLVVPASDLWSLVASRPSIFQHETSHNIAYCYFCRAHIRMTDRGERHAPSELENLLGEAREHGHCLWCHQPYPRDPRDGSALHDEGRHFRRCQAINEMGEVDTQ